jgi:hypothetical protein
MCDGDKKDSYSPGRRDHTPENRVVRIFEEKVVGEKEKSSGPGGEKP